MSSYGQLEIIRANGEIEFYTLDPAAGITNIGRHPDNDIIIDSLGVAPFHAILDHRQAPYQMILLSPEGQSRIGNEALVPHTPRSLQHWDNIEIDGHRLILVETGDVDTGPALPGVAAPPPSGLSAPQADRPVPVPYTPIPARPASYPPPTTRPESPDRAVEPFYGSPEGAGRTAASTTAGVSTPAVAGMFDSLPSDHADEALIINLSEREWIINVEQTATFQMTVTNGGPIVATFTIGVQGLDPSWVEISESQVNLFEGDRATVTISIRPPRLPSSRAGAHHFAVIVSSANYPGRFGRCGATVVINPYYQFSIGDLSPRRQTISWFRHFGTVTIPITNLGNSQTHFRLDGGDDERALSFEFDVPGETVTLAKQAELVLHPEEGIAVPISITPHSRRLMGFRQRSYPFTITTNMLEGQQTPRSVLGELRSKPLIGPWVFLLMSLVLLILILFITRPRLNTFIIDFEGSPDSYSATISNGTPVAIKWGASIFTTDREIIGDPDPIDELERPVVRRGRVVTYPKSNTTYTFIGQNILSRQFEALFPPAVATLQVDVIAIPPDVTFEAEPSEVVSQDEVTLRWQVQNADKIELFRRIGEAGAPEVFIDDFSDQPAAAIQVTPEPDQETTTFILKASNNYVPTPTPEARPVVAHTPTPEVLFSANPIVINEGESSTLTWRVSGVQQVTLQDPGGITSQQRAEDQTLVFPGTSGDYTLLAGQNVAKVRIEVIPATPTPTTTPEPDAPQIILFNARPKELVEGSEDQVELSWQINQNFTNGEISSPNLGTIPFTDRIGSIMVTVKETTLFALTAFNGDKQSSTTTGVDVLTPTPTTTPPPPTNTPIPPAEIIGFKIIAPGAPEVVEVPGSSPLTYKVQKGKEVTFQWETNNAATKVTFTESSTGAAEVGTVPIGQTKKTITANGNYTLVAANLAGQETSPKVIQIELIGPPPPPPPFNLSGIEGTNTITLTWEYDPDSIDKIDGFRVYDVNSPNSPLVNEGTLDKNADTYVVSPPGGQVCGQGYYVVAVYIDVITGNKVELPSVSSWFSAKC